MICDNTVFIVHCIDSEGPLYESIGAKFERLKELFNIENIEPTQENMEKLKLGQIDLGGIENKVQKILSGHLANYLETWDQVDKMLDQCTSSSFRNNLLDSYGNGWIYNWFCLDYVNFEYNPRRRDIGYHNIFDHYQSYLKYNNNKQDGLGWHFHPMTTYREAHRCATSFFRTPDIFQILTRKIIDRKWFPSAFRAGFMSERPDSHWFLEQWIPFDISNMSIDDNHESGTSIDLKDGRAGDWRSAPSDWSIYHPDHDNYQVEGNCRRWIARALLILNRVASLDQREVDKAFQRVQKGLPTIMGIASHDYRDLTREVIAIRNMIETSSKRFPNVRFKYCEVNEAFLRATGEYNNPGLPLKLGITYKPRSENDVPSIEIITKQGKVFGPQPFLAIQTKSKSYIFDNFDFSPSQDRWYYAFHGNTLPIEDVQQVGVAANDSAGNTEVKILDFSSGHTAFKEI